METMLSHGDFKVEAQKDSDDSGGDRSGDKSDNEEEIRSYTAPHFAYFEPRPPRFTVVLERTSPMGAGDRWTSIKRAMFRFFHFLPTGAEVAVVTYGKEAQLNLPPTPVREGNREGLHGRIPRKVLREELACVYCALNLTLRTMRRDSRREEVDGGAVILVTGSSRRPQLLDRLVREVSSAPVQVFPIVYPGSAHPEVTRLAAHGKVYAVPDEADGVAAVGYLSEVLLDVLHRTGAGRRRSIQKVHESTHRASGSGGEFAGTFTLGEALSSRMSVTLGVDDEERVEFFEITSPSGGKGHHFSKFEDGMVVFSHPGVAEVRPGFG